LNDERETDHGVELGLVLSAYASVMGDQAYLSMPITTGRRYYETLDRYGARTAEELERRHPGVLKGEILVPNLLEGKSFAAAVAPEIDASLICPGIFDARRAQWGQEEYMMLWLGLIASSIREIYLSDGWEYSNGGATELAQALLVRHRFVEGRDDRMPIYNHRRQEMDLVTGAHKLIAAIRDLDRRGFSTIVLRQQLSQIAGIAAYLTDPLTDRREAAFHGGFARSTEHLGVVAAARKIGVSASLD
jgi:hypothetical protein